MEKPGESIIGIRLEVGQLREGILPDRLVLDQYCSNAVSYTHLDVYKRQLQYCKISEVKGILNATTNYVLEEMTKGVPMDVIMENGRRGGFMEADASMYMKGWDAAAKLTALLNVLMDAGITPDQIDRTGIEEVTAEDIQRAAEHGCKVKLLCKGKIEDGKVVGIVKPSEIKADDAFAGSDVVRCV